MKWVLIEVQYMFCFQMKAFDREVQAYTYTIPKLQVKRSEKNLKPLPFPKCFYASAKDELLILENLKAQNFVILPKKPERKFETLKCYADICSQFHQHFKSIILPILHQKSEKPDTKNLHL